MMSPANAPTTLRGDDVRAVAGNFHLILLGLGAVWALEILVAKGPLLTVYGSISAPLTAVILFVAAAAAAVSVGRRWVQPDAPSRTQSFSYGPGLLCVLASVVAFYAATTQQSSYELVLAHENESLVGQLWAPLSLAAAALLIVSMEKASVANLLLLLVLVISSAAAGGRTVPGLMLTMFFLSRMLLHSEEYRLAGPNSRLKRYVAWTVVAFSLVVLMSWVGAVRSNAIGGDGFTPDDMARNGYGAGPLWLQYLVATLGVIGESARITHVAVPDLLPYQGATLLISDILSFLPQFEATVTQATMEPYAAVGSIIFTSRPGGTPTTLYLLGGYFGVLVGAFMYTLALVVLVSKARTSRRILVSVAALLLTSTYVLGMYGTGTPTAATMVAFLLVSIWVACGRLLRWA
jgi:hypothetical protein